MEKKSLIKALKTTKKSNLAASPAKNEGTSTRKTVTQRYAKAALKRAGKVSLSDFSS
jgi:hypothetical protein